MNQTYITNGYVSHKQLFQSLISIWGLVAIVTLALRVGELSGLYLVRASLLSLVALLLVTAYMVYMVRMTLIKIQIKDTELLYESSIRKGFLFYRQKNAILWKNLTEEAIHFSKEGPITIAADSKALVYWNYVNPKENYDLYRVIVDKVQEISQEHGVPNRG